MDLRRIVNPVSEGPPRRSPSSSHHVLASSPAMSSANLPTPPPPATHQTTMTGKRKRTDPKPIWAFRENEIDNDGNTLNAHRDKLQQSRPAPTPQTQAQAQARPPPMAMHNGPPPMNGCAPPPSASHRLAGFARPISDDLEVYDDVSRQVCDFIWKTVIDNAQVRRVIAEDPATQVEVEARWGQIQSRADGQRLQGIHDTECVVKPTITADMTKFESTMTMEQHKKMNGYLNSRVQKSTNSPERIEYKHTREIDQFYELDQDGFNRLSPAVRQVIAGTKQRARIRITRDAKNQSTILGAIIKCRIDNLEISSPQTEWDYRIGVNLEVKFPGPLDNLKPVIEPGKSLEKMTRYKDRVSYSWLKAFQIDLTMVIQDDRKNHELELELNSGILLQNGDRIAQEQESQYETLINGMMNNLRVLSREITPRKP